MEWHTKPLPVFKPRKVRSRQTNSSLSPSIMDVDSSLAGPASPAESSAQGAAAAAAAASAGPHATSVNRRYPIPPPAYKLFTADAWRAFEKRKDKQPATDEQTRANQPDDADAREDADDVVLTDEQLEAFEPPRVDWIEEDGGWQAFGQTHAVRTVCLLIGCQYTMLTLGSFHSGPTTRLHCDRFGHSRLSAAGHR